MTTVTVTLECEHITTADFEHDIWDGSATVHCFKCDVDRTIIVFRPMNDGYNFRCTQCKYARSYGVARLKCFNDATLHALRKHHTVIVRCDNKLVETIALAAPTLYDEIPF